MKACISSSGDTLEAPVDERFGRCRYFLIVDTETAGFEAVSNVAMGAGRGAGIQAAQTIANQGAEALVTGVVGPKAFAALQNAGIKIYEGASSNETVKETLEKFKNGGYREATAPSGGAGMGGFGRGRGGR